VIAPEAPAGGLIREAVLDDQADRRGDNPFGVVAAGGGQVGAVGVEVPAALGTVVLGVGQGEVAGAPGDEIAEVMEGAPEDPVTVGAMATAGAGPPPVVAATLADLGLGQILDAGDALGGVGQIFSGAGHGVVLLRVASYRRIRRLPRIRAFPTPVAVLETQSLFCKPYAAHFLGGRT
jgi:hypothetical protein